MIRLPQRRLRVLDFDRWTKKVIRTNLVDSPPGHLVLSFISLAGGDRLRSSRKFCLEGLHMMTLNRRSFLALTGSSIAPFALGAASLSMASTIDETLYFNESFRRFGPEPSARVARLATGMKFTEGPCWFDDGRYLLFSDLKDNKIWRYDTQSEQVAVFRAPSYYSNGLARDLQGRLVVCEHAGRRVTRVEPDGSITILADRFEGKRFNSPNDLAIHRDGSIWFTDPDYGLKSRHGDSGAPAELPMQVYRLDPDAGTLSAVARDPVKPNGICFAPGYSKLYVTDSSRQFQLLVYDVIDGGKLSKSRSFGERLVGVADGIVCDRKGNVWASSGWRGAESNGVQVFAPDGKLIGFIRLPEVCSNVCFGGETMDQLFMTARTSLYSIGVASRGF